MVESSHTYRIEVTAYIVREVVPEEYITTDSRQIVDRTYEHTQHDTITQMAVNYTDIIIMQININCDVYMIVRSSHLVCYILVCIKSHISCILI